MTKVYSTPANSITTAITKQQRQLKVREAYHSYQLNQQPRQRTAVGEIHLKGHWLIQAGFEIDHPVRVQVHNGKLVITTS